MLEMEKKPSAIEPPARVLILIDTGYLSYIGYKNKMRFNIPKLAKYLSGEDEIAEIVCVVRNDGTTVQFANALQIMGMKVIFYDPFTADLKIVIAKTVLHRLNYFDNEIDSIVFVSRQFMINEALNSLRKQNMDLDIETAGTREDSERHGHEFWDLTDPAVFQELSL